MNYKDYKNNLLEYEVFNYPLQNYLVLRLLKTNQRYQGDQKGQARFNAWPFKDFILWGCRKIEWFHGEWNAYFNGIELDGGRFLL